MSKAVGINNAVRVNCDLQWLTPSQQQVYDQLRSGFDHQRVLNVYGVVGAGKTVLAWVLEREGYGTYLPDASELLSGGRRVLIDNYDSSRKARKLIDFMDELQISQVVLFTQKRIDDDFPAFEVKLTEEDIAHCKATLFQKLDLHFYDETSLGNLHDLLRFQPKGG
jgi:hypothetical protein